MMHEAGTGCKLDKPANWFCHGSELLAPRYISEYTARLPPRTVHFYPI